MTDQYDIAIIGGGPVGAALALSLSTSTLKVCVLESRPADVASEDARALALSFGSRLLLDRINLWDTLDDVSPIHTIHISQQHSFGRTLLHASDLNVPELGYVLPYTALQHSLDQALLHSNTTLIYGASVTDLQSSDGHATVSYQQCGTACTLLASLAIVADGGKVLAQRNPPEVRDYGQSALITHISCSAPQVNTAFERFTPQGPVALLPFQSGYELVWTAPHHVAQDMLVWDDSRFLMELQQHFGERVGTFLSVGKRSCFPLGLKRAPQQIPMPRAVLIGNAAQAMHPVAGQGFNLGLRDSWELAQVILDTPSASLGSDQMLAAYCSRRRTDREAAIRFTDGLVRLFSNDLALLSTGRAAALTALDCLPFAKRFVAKRMMFGANG